MPDICNGHDLEAVTGIPAATWRYYAYSGQGPVWFKAGRHRLYRKENVLAWIAAQEAKSAAGA
ncbi:MAG: helix-turn-helix domain-containing protein [Mycobacterium sp.]|nr:helix-turn-helix domain-containing protein [Mycobacterium sp.]